ncbi:diacylglyceryl transferase [Mesoplasma chauliocola]|uniref:Diacylglyceryl transferase n=1 Tax=Mesoplasma chauliocola TaxID=216427 RepID=A0A249SMA7_9MOLU|nr:prolipoprotein diacylglyceryl transferase family protein [Mesoplasma chauliocola]ASZ08824.1 diacylglyceryl transferase [Mesoplasma chauliocola]
MWKEGMTYYDFYLWLNQNSKSPEDMRLLFGLVPAYPVFMFLGICLVILITVIQMNKRKIPLRELEIGIVIIVPIGIIGGTFFGKVFLPNYQSFSNFYKVFFFWQPGMSFFGAIGLGSVAGFGWFYKRSKVTQISMWVYLDLIIVNVLLGHALGRWGNLYNQEILGNGISYDSISWMPNFIKHRLFYFPDLLNYRLATDLSKGVYDDPTWWIQITNGSLDPNAYVLCEVVNGQWVIASGGATLADVLENPIQFRQPLFLIEGVGNIILWLLITFGVKNINRFANKKNNPWNITPEAYPCFWNPKYKTISEKELKDWYTLAPIKYKRKKIIKNGKETIELTMSLRSVWNKAYYWVEPDYESNAKIVKEIEDWKQDLLNTNFKLENDKKQLKIKLEKLKMDTNKKIKFSSQDKHEILKNEYKQLVAIEKNKLKKQKQEINLRFNFGERYLGVNRFAKQLAVINNPNSFIATRAGVASGFYILGYGILRTILETQRKPTEYMIPNHVITNFLVLGLIILIGLAIVVITQFIVPYKWREAGWLYEKTY